MSSCSSVLFEHSFAISRVLLIQVRFILNQLPSSMLRHLLMFFKALLQVASKAVVYGLAILTLQNVDVKHIYRSRKCWASTPCKHIISGTISLRSQRFFSPFPRGTCSLSVANEYLGLRRGRRRFIRSFTCIVLLRKSLGVLGFSVTGLSPSMAQLSRSFT